MAPGGDFYSGISLAIVGGLLGCFVSWLVAAVAFLLSIVLILMAIVDSGYREPATAYQGFKCPKCGQRNWIWPWNL